MAFNNPFSTNQYDLGVSPIDGLSKEGVDELFIASQYPSTPCLICGSTAKYRLIPLHKHLATAEIQDKGFACAHCINRRCISPKDFKLIDL